MTPSNMFCKTIVSVFLIFVVKECLSCSDNDLSLTQLTVPLINATQDKRFYLGVYFKTTWRQANQFCLQHGMKLATIESEEENDKLERAIRDLGHNDEYFFTSATDLGQEGQFYWMTTGRPVAYTNWAPGEPSDLRLHASVENCLAVINMGSSALKWHDLHCIYEKYFICEIRSDTWCLFPELEP